MTAPVISCTPTRTSGVAPLGVVFDATGTTGPSKPFHDLSYLFFFGDASPGVFNYGANTTISKNQGRAAVAGHVFEMPGSYTWFLIVWNGTESSMTSGSITVTNPDTVFSTTNTICISTSGNFTGAPTGSSHVTDSDFDAQIIANATATKRVLFCRGETFASSAAGTVSAAGAITIGAYGTGALPIVTSTNIAGVLSLNNAAVNDLRIMDLDIRGSGTSDTGVAINVGAAVNNITLLRTTMQNIGKGLIIQSGSSITGSILQENTILNYYAPSGGNAFFGQAFLTAIIGNNIGPAGATAEHGIRLQPGYKCLVSNNTITTPGGTGDKQVLTLRALEHGVDPSPDSQYVVISDNKLTGNNSTQMFQVAPASNAQNNWIYDVIVERNWIIFGTVTQQGLYSESVRLTVRNNVCNSTTGAASGRFAFSNDHTNTAGAPTPDDNQFVNNTHYDNTANGAYCVTLGYSGGQTITNTLVRNNIAYAPLATSPKVVYLAPVSTGITGTTGASGTEGNSSDVEMGGTSPGFSGTTFFAGFRPASASGYPNTGGTASFPATKVDAFLGQSNNATIRRGAMVAQSIVNMRGVGS